MRLGRLDEALAAFEEAIRLERSAAAYQRKGWVLGLAGRVDEAERAYERARKLAPRNIETLASLASLAARKGNAERARKYAERALALDPHNPGAHIALAIVEVAAGTSSRRLSVCAPSRRIHRLGVMNAASCLRFSATPLMARTRRAKHSLPMRRQMPNAGSCTDARFTGGKSAGEILDHLIAALAESPIAGWLAPEPAAARADGPLRHVFLLGFPRSGTTLLERALARNSQIATLDERDFLAGIAERYLTNAAGVESLSRLDGAVLADHREDYWRGVHASGLKLAGRVFVDKQPFHTIKLPLIAKLFPGAQVLFSLRDPRDVVLSCFRRQLDMDLLRFEFLTLEGAAAMYDRFMRFADVCRGKLPLSFFDHRYEDLIADFDATTRAVCAWLDVPWHESMRDVGANARELLAIKASAMQVRRGLYRKGVGQWRRYRLELGPVLPALRPWVARFGYADC